jgi:hypothetical protein
MQILIMHIIPVPVTFLSFWPIILISTVTQHVKDQISHPYKTRDKFRPTVLHTCILYLYWNQTWR